MNIYETDRLVHEYLLFHYAEPEEILSYDFGPRAALDFPVRCVTETFDLHRLPPNARALDIGCAVGRSSFELAKHCAEVIGIDFSHRFIEEARKLASGEATSYQRLDEGVRYTMLQANAPAGVDCSRVHFEQGDACALRRDLGRFDAVLAANLMCRLPDPAAFLDRLPELMRSNGQLVITTPCTWMEEFTPREKWLCDERRTTFEALREILAPAFELKRVFDLPMLIREHARKFQWTVTQASCWVRR